MKIICLVVLTLLLIATLYRFEHVDDTSSEFAQCYSSTDAINVLHSFVRAHPDYRVVSVISVKRRRSHIRIVLIAAHITKHFASKYEIVGKLPIFRNSHVKLVTCVKM